MPEIIEISPIEEKITLQKPKDVKRIIVIMFKKTEDDISRLAGKYRPKIPVNTEEIVKKSLDELYDRYSFHR